MKSSGAWLHNANALSTTQRARNMVKMANLVRFLPQLKMKIFFFLKARYTYTQIQ